MMKTYIVYMVNFQMIKGTFSNESDAVAQAKALGFECAIICNGQVIRTVKPY